MKKRKLKEEKKRKKNTKEYELEPNRQTNGQNECRINAQKRIIPLSKLATEN